MPPFMSKNFNGVPSRIFLQKDSSIMWLFVARRFLHNFIGGLHAISADHDEKIDLLREFGVVDTKLRSCAYKPANCAIFCDWLTGEPDFSVHNVCIWVRRIAFVLHKRYVTRFELQMDSFGRLRRKPFWNWDKRIQWATCCKNNSVGRSCFKKFRAGDMWG